MSAIVDIYFFDFVEILDIPGEICQGRCFKSATHSGGNLPGIPDESLPLVL
jgi:hypothetical protein